MKDGVLLCSHWFFNKTEHGNITLYITVVAFYGFTMRCGLIFTNITKIINIIIGCRAKTDYCKKLFDFQTEDSSYFFPKWTWQVSFKNRKFNFSKYHINWTFQVHAFRCKWKNFDFKRGNNILACGDTFFQFACVFC